MPFDSTRLEAFVPTDTPAQPGRRTSPVPARRPIRPGNLHLGVLSLAAVAVTAFLLWLGSGAYFFATVAAWSGSVAVVGAVAALLSWDEQRRRGGTLSATFFLCHGEELPYTLAVWWKRVPMCRNCFAAAVAREAEAQRAPAEVVHQTGREVA